MTTIAERVTSLATRRGVLATVTRDATTSEGESYDPRTDTETPGTPPTTSYSVKVMPDDTKPDDFAPDTLIYRNPIAVILPNGPAVTFAPESGMELTILGVTYTIASALPRMLDGAVQFWRVVGGV